MKYDVFVSYAHVNNQPFVPEQPGWVSTLVENLRASLAQKLPRKDGVAGASVWMDPRLPRNREFDAEIEEALRQSATLLIVHSSAYLDSDWCRRERESFLKGIEERGEPAKGRVFVVEYEEAPRPPELSKLLGYRFWCRDADDPASRPLGFPVPTPDERAYYNMVLDVAAEMAARIRSLRAEGPAPAPAPAGPTVYLAETTEDLDAQRDETRRYLNQAGFRVVPEGWYPRDDPAQYAAAATRDMAGAKLFVQLLGPVPGRRPPTLPEGYGALQCRLAEEAKLEVVQWRPRDLDPRTVADPHLKTLLERATVQATGLEEFKRNVVEILRRPPPPPPPPPPDPDAADDFKLVFVNHDRADQELARSIFEALQARQLGASRMLDQGTPEEMREFLQANLVSCDGLILVYGDTSQAWLISQVQEYRKARARRERALRAWAVCEGPPPERGELAFQFPNLKVINCRRGFDAASLDEFVAGLAAEGAQ
jgi:hypothetical protein